MLPQGVFPLHLVNQVIDELGKAYRPDHRIHPHAPRSDGALRACTLVSKKWTFRSRTHLFKKVRIEVQKGQPTRTPPASILPHIKKLEIWCGDKLTQVPPTVDLLKAFSKAPLERIGITNGALVDKRAIIQEWINAHSATLRTVKFKDCSISSHTIADVMVGGHCLKRLRLVNCKCEQLPPPGRPLIADTPDSDAPDMELSIYGDDIWEGTTDIATMAARLPYRFSRLDVFHLVAGEGTTEATNALIKANAGVLSSLQVHLWAEDMEVDVEPEHLFSLKGCSNLSELTLDMELSESCAVQDSIFILSTLDPTRQSHLGKIVLEARYVGRWFDKDGPTDIGDKRNKDEDEEDESEEEDRVNWEGLDTVLSRLAEVSSIGGKRLTFVLVVLEWGGDENSELVPTARKWLPKLLPRFNELGLLHVHYGRGSR